jgi:hypothetical protein
MYDANVSNVGLGLLVVLPRLSMFFDGTVWMLMCLRELFILKVILFDSYVREVEQYL